MLIKFSVMASLVLMSVVNAQASSRCFAIQPTSANDASAASSNTPSSICLNNRSNDENAPPESVTLENQGQIVHSFMASDQSGATATSLADQHKSHCGGEIRRVCHTSILSPRECRIVHGC